MPTFTVERAEQKKTVDGKYGPMQVIALRLEHPGNDGPIEAEWFTKATTPLPAAGSTLDGDLEDGQYGKNFKKAKPEGGFGGGGGMSPERQRAIQRQHSQEMAIRLYAASLSEADKKAPPFQDGGAVLELIKRLTDWFDADVNDADSSGGAPPMVQSPSASSTAAVSVANGSAISEKQLAFMDRLLREAGVDVQDRLDIGAWAKEKLTGGQGGSASAAIEAIKSGDDGITRLLTAAKGWVDTQPTVPGDERDLQPAPASVIGAAGSDIEF